MVLEICHVVLLVFVIVLLLPLDKQAMLDWINLILNLNQARGPYQLSWTLPLTFRLSTSQLGPSSWSLILGLNLVSRTGWGWGWGQAYLSGNVEDEADWGKATRKHLDLQLNRQLSSVQRQIYYIFLILFCVKRSLKNTTFLWQMSKPGGPFVTKKAMSQNPFLAI